ncbi:DUF4299 family protein [Streptococcus sp. DD13]|uniref:DUF4299 family protein n=1 Tax=Streptococcus sp. DD13 TaxID=1777881 RepID=UPI000796F5C4|nr:DUF4299 family protein [Streptococcus sp. DD13]KXT78734.1 hypothetical protein STRDD13_00466 [Streptococcus sp. DD13]
MVKRFLIPNKISVLGEQEILTAKAVLGLVDGLESHSYEASHFLEPLDRLQYMECALVGKSRFLFKVSYADSQKAYQVELPDLLTRKDWAVAFALIQALSTITGNPVAGLEDFSFDRYFQESVRTYLTDKKVRFTLIQGIFHPIFLSQENLESFLEADGLEQFEALVDRVQFSDAHFGTATFYQDQEQRIHGVYRLAQGVKTVLPKEPFVPASYVGQLAGKEVHWELHLVQVKGDGSKPEDYEAIAGLDYFVFLNSLSEELLHELDANQLEISPLSPEEFEKLSLVSTI